MFFLEGVVRSLPPYLPQVLPQEVEALFDMRDAGFLGRELQAPFEQEPLDQWLDFILQQLFRASGDDEVIGISHEVHLRVVHLPIGSSVPAKGLLEKPLQPVQCQVRQRRRDDAALWRTCLRGEQRSIFHEASLQPFPQHLLVRGDVVEHPFVADVIEAATNVAFQHPLRR